jgi:cyclophilin family peptidyl-prolyl cis-trans isomerase
MRPAIDEFATSAGRHTMTSIHPLRGAARTMRPAATPALLAVLAVLAACGGGSDPAPIPTVNGVAVSNTKYNQQLVITVTGTDVNQGLNVSSPSCTGVTLSEAAPYVSSAATAYYRCRASATGASTVTVARGTDAVTLGTAAFTVPQPQVTMSLNAGATALGEIVFTLAPNNAPITVDNFLNYVNAGFYVGTVFHRIASNPAVVQGGGFLAFTPPAAPVARATNPPIVLEVGKGLGNVQWSVGMARTGELNSATSQFFINLQNNPTLDTLNGGYAVFGAITAGTSVVSAIAASPCTPADGVSECVPVPAILITGATQTQ